MDDPAAFARRLFVSPRVVAVPSSDAEFVRFVRDAASDQVGVRALEDWIRRRYPKARIRPNDLSGQDAVWYAYRDGRWEPGRPSRRLPRIVIRLRLTVLDGRLAKSLQTNRKTGLDPILADTGLGTVAQGVGRR